MTNRLALTRLALLSSAIATLPVACKKNADLLSPSTPASVVSSDLQLSKLAIKGLSSPGSSVYPPGNLVDGNLSTIWSSENDPNAYLPDPNSQYVTFRLDTTVMHYLGSIKIAVYTGGSTTLHYNFDVLVSQDGQTGWVNVLNSIYTVAGSTTFQTCGFSGVKGNYVRIVGHGNNGSSPKVNAWSEVEIYGTTADPSLAEKVYIPGYQASTNNFVSPYVASNVVDGNLHTYWTSKMTGTTDYKNVTVNLGRSYYLDFLKLSFYTGGDNKRVSRFGVFLSPDSTHWQKVIFNTYSASNAYGERLEIFDFPDNFAKFVRVECYGHTGSYSSSSFNSINELEAWGQPSRAVNPDLYIQKVTFRNTNNPYTYSVYYNAQQNPDSIGAGPVGYPYKFTYNSSNQLIRLCHYLDIQGKKQANHYYTWAGSHIVTDSFSAPSSNFTKVSSSIQYDVKGRITSEQVTQRYINPSTTQASTSMYTIPYVYDDNGNLKTVYWQNGMPTNTPVLYDNYWNYLSLSSLWMFISRDYSTFNAKQASFYTYESFPSSFPDTAPYVNHSFLDEKPNDLNQVRSGDPKLLTYGVFGVN